MKKRLIIVISILVLISIISFVAYSNYIKTKETLTGKAVTGEATNSNFAVAITIFTREPNVSLFYPENETYITTQDLWLNYSSSNTYAIWYKLDSDPNITLTGNTTFNVSEGTHTLYLYANNTDGNETSDSVIFSVNSSKFRVIYDEYMGSTRGSSTDFNKSSYEDLQDLSEILLENTDWGKIQFYGGINVTDDSDFSDYETNLNAHTNISENRIELDSTPLPNFNKSATLYLYNLNFNDPRILRDGSLCPDSICTELNYSGGNLIFNVTQFTVYSAEETSIISPPGEDGGGSVALKGSFKVDLDSIATKLKQGQIATESITLTNNGTKRLYFELEDSPILRNLLKISEKTFSLDPGESKVIIIDMIAREDTIPDLYLGKISVKANGLEKEIFVLIEIESKAALLDVRAEILKEYKEILPGEEILSEIRLFNLGGEGRQDILMEYIIKDYDENRIFKETESLAIETQITFVKRIYIPEGTNIGRYVLYVRAIYDEEVSSASDNFKVVSKKITTQEKIYIGMMLILIAIINAIIYYIITRDKKQREKISKKRKEEKKELFHIIEK
jgi:uncharacterized membrane protein